MGPKDGTQDGTQRWNTKMEFEDGTQRYLHSTDPDHILDDIFYVPGERQIPLKQ